MLNYINLDLAKGENVNYFAIGAILGCTTIIIGAFGAHGLKNILDEYSKSIFEKAILYQMFHTIAILLLGTIEKLMPNINLYIPGLLFLLGIIIFSGSLYVLAITSIKWMGAITPIGGLLFIIGWIIIFIKMV
tara:strand:- start:45 stop:443 length:399 start_codon:yes stop_codon:yes gene_type:complete